MTEALTPTRQNPAGTVTGPLVAAIEHLWAAIQVRHPDVPDVVLTLGNGSTRPGQLTLGHFHAGKWATRDQSTNEATRLPELFVGGEGLAAGPRDLLGTLLHEAAHGVAAAREVQDTSRQGRYHNTRYREIATELGITVERDPRIGWSLTTVPDSTAALYAEHIGRLGDAMRAHRLADTHGTGRGPSSNNGLVAVCECDPPRKIRLSRTAYDVGPVVCGVCEADFTSTDTQASEPPAREGRAVMTSSNHATSHASVADQVELDAQLRWLTYLHQIDAPIDQIEAATQPILARVEHAASAVADREAEHYQAAQQALRLYRNDLAGGASESYARAHALGTVARTTEGPHSADSMRQREAAAALAEPVTEAHIDAAPTPEVRDLLIRDAAAQQALGKLAGTHADTAADVIGLYDDGRGEFDEDADGFAADAAMIEASTGIPAIYENAYYDLDYRAELRAEQKAEQDRARERATADDEDLREAVAWQLDDERLRREVERQIDRIVGPPDVSAPPVDWQSDTIDWDAVREQREPRSVAPTERAEHGRDEDDHDRGDAVIDSARAAVNVLAARRREQDARRNAYAARAEQLTHWHHDDHHRTTTAGVDEHSPVRGGRAIYGWGTTR